MHRKRLAATFAVCIALGPRPAVAASGARAVDEEEGGKAAPGRAEPARLAPQDRPEMDWWRTSMETRETRLGWWREARFGMFVHWGVYAHLAGVWEGRPVTGYSEHIQRKSKIPIPVYRERVAGAFNPTAFDADEWVRTLKNAGMGYLVITAKHHDGFAMYDSKVDDDTVVKATPWKRDPMRPLKEACDRHGIRFGFYYSHAFDWGEENGPGNDWDYKNPGGDLLLHGADWWEGAPELLPRIRRYVDGKSIPQVLELIRNYDPDILWFDTAHKLPLEENLRILRAAREAKPTIVVNGRITQGAPGGPRARFGDYLSTTDKPAEFPPNDGDWEAIPTTNESYGYHRMDDSHKPPAHFIQLLAKAAARGGNMLMNIGPMGDGRFDPKDVAILDGIGAWMKVNGDAIRGTTRTPLPVQAWGESTRRGNTLYLHVFAWPRTGRLVVGGLVSEVQRAYLLSDAKRTPLRVRRAGRYDVAVDVPDTAPDAVDSVVVLEMRGEIEADERRLLIADVSVDTLRAFDARLEGEGLAFGAGKARDAYVYRWSKADAQVRWPLRLAEPATFDVAIAYDAPAESAGGKFVVKIGERALEGAVEQTPERPVGLGRVSLPAGLLDLSVAPVLIKGEELMRLRAVTLTPVQPAGQSSR